VAPIGWANCASRAKARCTIGWKHIADAIKAADALRLATIPQTAAFGKQWAAFQRHHENLNCGAASIAACAT
jgi:hypothetical protein